MSGWELTHQDEAAGTVGTVTAPDCLLWEETEERLRGGSRMVTDGDGHMTGPGQLPWEHQGEGNEYFLLYVCFNSITALSSGSLIHFLKNMSTI